MQHIRIPARDAQPDDQIVSQGPAMAVATYLERRFFGAKIEAVEIRERTNGIDGSVAIFRLDRSRGLVIDADQEIGVLRPTIDNEAGR